MQESLKICEFLKITFSFHRLYVQKKDQTENKHLNVTVLQLPSNIKMFNTGASMEKWCQKRLRLKSTKKTDKYDDKDETTINNDELIINQQIDDKYSEMTIKSPEPNNPQQIQQQQQQQVDDPFNKYCLQDSDDYEVDSDVEKLITQFIQKPDEMKTNKKKQRRKRKRHIFNKKKKETNNNNGNNGNKNKLKKKGIILYSPIKPPSPSTLEVIRVNVTSNYYSLENQDEINVKEDVNKHHDCLKGGRRYKYSFVLSSSRLRDEENLKKFEIECKKLVLSTRKVDEKSKESSVTV